jgi:hypothetical protein
MTQSRATYWAWVENQRSHKANEELERAKNDELARHDRVMEAQNQAAYEESVRAHKAAEANTIAATQQAEEASKRAAEANLTKTRADERIARMQVVSNAKQKEADRQMNFTINSLNNDIKQQSVDIDKILADSQVARTEAEKQKWIDEVSIARDNQNTKFKEYLLAVEDQARKNADSEAARKLANQKFQWEKAQKRFDNAIKLFDTGRGTVNDVVDNLKKGIDALTSLSREASRIRNVNR